MSFLSKVKEFLRQDSKTMYCAHCGSENLKYSHQVMHCKDCNMGDDRIDIIENCYLCGSNIKINTKYYKANDKRKLICNKCEQQERELREIDDKEDFFDLYKSCNVCGKQYKVNNNFNDGICPSCNLFEHTKYKGVGACCSRCGCNDLIDNFDTTMTCKNCGAWNDRVDYIEICHTCGATTIHDMKYWKTGRTPVNPTCYNCTMKEKDIDRQKNCSVCGKEYVPNDKSDTGLCSYCELENIKRDYKDSKNYQKIELKEIQKCRDCGNEFNPKNTNDDICDKCKN